MTQKTISLVENIATTRMIDDNDVELVERRAIHNSIEKVLVPRPISDRIRRQNAWWFTGLFSFIVLTSGVIVLILNKANEQGKSDMNPYTDEDQNSEENELNNDNFPNHDTQKVKPSKNIDEVQKWLDANVTLKHGPMFEVIEQLHHSKKYFTEGLTYADGVLYESIGLNGQSKLVVLNASSGETIQSYDIDKKYFGEGLTYANGKLIQLTWKSKTGFIYDAANLSVAPKTFSFSTTRNEGWGITFDSTNNQLIVSDGSDFLHFWDPETMQEQSKVQVIRQKPGQRANNINELEFWRMRVLANVWYEDTILVINPETGIVEKEYDFRSLWPLADRNNAGADVLNGISVSDDPDVLYVTGKYWNRMFLVKLLY